mgnify:CR=1 FL=1
MNLGSITPKTQRQIITPSGAVDQIDNRRTHSEFAHVEAYDLLAQADMIGARLNYCRRLGIPTVAKEAATLQAMQAEIRSRESYAATWYGIAKEWERRNKIWSYFPDAGPLRRELYAKHMEFFAAGFYYRVRLFCAANKVGKTLGAGCEVAYHATGRYPHWWKGKRFDEPVLCWIANKSAKETRDINEKALLGPPGNLEARGTALLPSHLILSTTQKPGVPNACEFIYVRHVSGGMSTIQSKAFEAGREAFQGVPEVHVVWCDEECPKTIADECAIRTMTCGGVLMFTYTPILGMTDLTVELLDAAGVDLAAFALDVEKSMSDEENATYDRAVERQNREEGIAVE